jgi:hypothetical protein
LIGTKRKDGRWRYLWAGIDEETAGEKDVSQYVAVGHLNLRWYQRDSRCARCPKEGENKERQEERGRPVWG